MLMLGMLLDTGTGIWTGVGTLVVAPVAITTISAAAIAAIGIAAIVISTITRLHRAPDLPNSDPNCDFIL